MTHTTLIAAIMYKYADQHFENMMAANEASPYVHAEYQRHLSLARASLYLATEGDGQLAFALEQCFHDSNESMEYYLGKWSRDTLVEDYCGSDPLPMSLSFDTIS